MTTLSQKKILMDGRWSGTHGIGRFSAELASRLQHTSILTDGPRPLSLSNLLWQQTTLRRHKNSHPVYFTPGFQPVMSAPMPYVITLCDLIYLHTPGIKGRAKKWFFEHLIKPTLQGAYHVVTISEYSKQSIASWANIPYEKITNVSCGVSSVFSPEGTKHCPDYPYLFHVGNAQSHKNIPRLLEAFAHANIDPSIQLLLTCQPTAAITDHIYKHGLKHQVQWTGRLTEEELAAYYRGALGLILPSLYEGFGLPIVEAMACGTPVITSNTTSCPEVAGNAAMLIDPYDTQSIQHGIELVCNNSSLRDDLIKKGLKRAQDFSWDNTAALVQQRLTPFVLA